MRQASSDFTALQSTIEGILSNTHGVVVPDVNDIRLFFRGGGELEKHQFTLSEYLFELGKMKARFAGQEFNLLLVAKLRSHEHISEVLCWDDAPGVACFVPAIYVNRDYEESVTIFILK